ncbi:MAG TPA: PQQ-dependent sugar dehydrogenase [Streptosporangiaceae bacterium]|jgi:glucose/arabinose dehydrogenase
MRPRGLRAALGTAAITVAAALTAAGCGVGGGPQPTDQPTQTSQPTSASPSPTSSDKPKALATNLSVPWGLAFLPDGGALVTERDKADILRITPQGQVTPAGKVAGVVKGGEGGLLGIAISPDFTTDQSVYAYYTSATDNRIVRMKWTESGQVDGSLKNQQVILRGIPKGTVHNGGRLAFGPDGMLYASTGETGRGSEAQDKASLGGKILRMTPDGAPAKGNPFHTLVWSYGHRNVQGMAWDAQRRMYATEFGQDRWDEINRIEPGKDYGWPKVEGKGGGGKYVDPLVTWRTSEASPSGLAYAGSTLFAAALKGQRLWTIPVGKSGQLGKPKALLTGVYGRLRTVVPAPDNKSLWVTTSNRDGRGEPRPGDDKVIMIPLKGKGKGGSPTPKPSKSGSKPNPSEL